MARAVLPVLLSVVLLAAAIVARAGDRPRDDILHSDLPLFDGGGENTWPQRYEDDESFGCVSRIAFGDWSFEDRNSRDDVDAWYRFSNYGVFHCWANVARADERGNLDAAEPRPSFFVLLDRVRIDAREVELWAVQLGARPGSEYLLLSRETGDGLIDSFEMLHSVCPDADVRDAGTLDVLLTRYCVVPSRESLIALARRMAQLPPRGTLARVPAVDEVGDNDAEP